MSFQTFRHVSVLYQFYVNPIMTKIDVSHLYCHFWKNNSISNEYICQPLSLEQMWCIQQLLKWTDKIKLLNRLAPSCTYIGATKKDFYKDDNDIFVPQVLECYLVWFPIYWVMMNSFSLFQMASFDWNRNSKTIQMSLSSFSDRSCAHLKNFSDTHVRGDIAPSLRSNSTRTQW
jgi:hypothetical protein